MDSIHILLGKGTYMSDKKRDNPYVSDELELLRERYRQKYQVSKEQKFDDITKDASCTR
jgi:hypothetical protein